SKNVEPLRTLVNVVEPLKIYTRNPKGTLYNSYYSFAKFADAANTDAPDAWEFRKLTEAYCAHPTQAGRERLVNWLRKWKNNHRALLEIIQISPVLEEVKDLSEQLMVLSDYGLKAFEGPEYQSKSWEEQVEIVLSKARKQGGRTELQIVDAVKQLIEFEVKRRSEAPASL
ncbi:MAG: beta-hexosaminidase, partial [Cytophagales bacterium]|nr:beta-hexosaminidase [Cytophagales bacterium]